MTIYDFTSQQLQLLADLADLQNLGQIPTLSGINFQLAALNGSFSSLGAPQDVALVGGVATVERLARINIVSIDTQSGFWIDDFDSVAWSGTGGAVAGDIYIFLLKTQVHQVTVTGAGNLRTGKGQFKMDNAASSIAFVVANDLSLVEWSRYPNVATSEAALSVATSYVYTPTDTLAILSKIVDVIALGAETLAQGSIAINTATGGRVEAWVNEGAGDMMIGEYYWQSGDTAQDVADGLVASISAQPGYTAAILGGVPLVGVTAPAGTGSAANAYTLFSVVTTGITTTDVSFGGVTLGVDGTETAADIATFVGMDDGPIYLRNAMSAAAIILIAGGNITGTLPATIAAGGYKTILKVGTAYALPE